jgi:hypothetical protein
METAEFTISFKSLEFASQVGKILKNYGVVIIENVFEFDECDNLMTEIVECFEKISDGFDSKRYKRTWITENLPPMVRTGLFQGLVGNIPPVIEIRSSDRVNQVFQAAYSELREEKVSDFVSSLDGINLRPPIAPFYDARTTEDWAHLDIGQKGKTYDCIQGQVVLTSTSACFVCSPKSHLVYEDILDLEGKGKSSRDFVKLNQRNYPKHAEKIESVGGVFQMHIPAPPGSMILWLSSTAHSAKVQSDPKQVPQNNLLDGKWKDWRGIVYTCLRPKSEVSFSHAHKLKEAFDDNRLTNHYGDTIFPNVPFNCKKICYSKKMTKLINNPRQVYSIIPKHSSDNWKNLITK